MSKSCILLYEILINCVLFVKIAVTNIEKGLHLANFGQKLTNVFFVKLNHVYYNVIIQN